MAGSPSADSQNRTHHSPPWAPARFSCAWPPAQAVLSQPQLQPSAQEPQPQLLPLATQLSQILKRTLLKLQYILFLASKYPSISTYSWLFSAILQPPALNLSVLDFLFDPYRRKKKRLRHCFTRATTAMVTECWRWCSVGVHAITLFLGSRGGRMFLAVSALIEQHIRSFCLPNKKKTRLKPSTQLGCNVTPKAGNHTLSSDLEEPQARYSPLFGLLKPPRRCCRQSSTTCRSPCSLRRQCLSG